MERCFWSIVTLYRCSTFAITDKKICPTFFTMRCYEKIAYFAYRGCCLHLWHSFFFARWFSKIYFYSTLWYYCFQIVGIFHNWWCAINRCVYCVIVNKLLHELCTYVFGWDYLRTYMVTFVYYRVLIIWLLISSSVARLDKCLKYMNV